MLSGAASDHRIDADALPAQRSPNQPEISDKALCANIAGIDLGQPICV